MNPRITGVSAIANVGESAASVHQALCAGNETRAPLGSFDQSRYRARFAYEVDDRDGRLDRPGRATDWLIRAILAAAKQACIDLSDSSIPILVGTTMREQRSAELWWQGRADLSPEALNFGAALRARFGPRDVFTFANACSASLYSLALAYDLIGSGDAETVIVAGADSITESSFGAIDRVQERTPTALRPFDKSHRGMLMGEGAVAVVLTSRVVPGARALGSVLGVAINCDGIHPTAPDPAGIRAVVDDAHMRAKVTAPDIDLLLMHGSGTPRNDETEGAVMADVFRDHGGNLSVSAIKSMTGHTLGGSGLLSTVIALEAFRTGWIPPVLGLSDPIDEVATLPFVTPQARLLYPRVAQVNSFGFGGINAVAVVSADV